MSRRNKTRWSPKQLQVFRWWRDPATRDQYEAVLCDGAVRSGKTCCAALSFALWALYCQPGRKVALCGKTVRSLRRNLADDLFRVLAAGGCTVKEDRRTGSVRVSWAGRQVTFCLFGGRDEASAALIQGVTLAGVLFDEVALMPRSFVEQALARCSVPGARYWFTCNPEHPGHWFYREWIARREERRLLYLHFTMTDNPGLTPETRERYERMYTGRFYRRFVLGEWCAPEGQIYDMFSEEKQVRTPPPPPYDRYVISVDYGTVNPMSMALWGERSGAWWRLKESWYDSRFAGIRRTDEEHYAALEALAGDRRIEAVVIDPSAASFLACVREHGRFRAVAADNRVLVGIEAVSRWLNSGRLFLAPECRHAIEEFGLYRWEDGAERPLKEDDHAMDDLRYLVMYAEAARRRRSPAAEHILRSRR